MDVFTILTVWVFTAVFGAWTALALVHVVTGRIVFPLFAQGIGWSPHEVKLSGWGWLLCGVSGVVMALVGGLIFGAHAIPVFWAGSPWGIFANPMPIILVGNGAYQVLIDQRHKGRWPFRRSSNPATS